MKNLDKAKKDYFDILDYKEPIIKIYLVRHGQTNANRDGIIFGQMNWDLNKTGIKQAKRVAAKLFNLTKDKQIHCLISSPLLRTRHTGKIISKKLKLKKTIINKDLIERSEGSWEGRTYWQVRKEDPKNYLRWVKEPFNNKPPQGESIYELSLRVKQFYKSLLSKYKGGNIIIVSHSGPIKMFLLNLLGLNINKFWNLKIDCGSYTEIHLSKKHYVLVSTNNKF